MRKVESAYIMAAGAGERMGGKLHSKPMTPIGGKPLIAFGIEALMEYGVSHICIVYAEKSRDVLELRATFPEIEFLKQEEVTGSLSTLGVVGSRATTPFLLLDADIIVLKEHFIEMMQSIPEEAEMDAWFAAVKHPWMPGVCSLEIEDGLVRVFRKQGFEEPKEIHYQGGMIYVWARFPAGSVERRLAAAEKSMAEFLTDVAENRRVGAMYIETLWDVDTPEEAERSEELLEEMGKGAASLRAG